MNLLENVLDLIFPPRKRASAVASAELSDIPVFPCMTESGAVALMPYRDTVVRALIAENKYCGNGRARELLSQVLHDYLMERLSDAMGPERLVLVPIPLSRRRFRERGYNQVTEVAKRAVPPQVELAPQQLRRVRDTKPQTSLGKQARSTNMEGAFIALGALDPDATYLVLDDVVTTGATLNDAKRALHERGARFVDCVALAY